MSLPKNIDPSKSNLEPSSIDERVDVQATRCSTITGRGRSAIAVVAVRGPQAATLITNHFDAATKDRVSRRQSEHSGSRGSSYIRFGSWCKNAASEASSAASIAAESVVLTQVGDDEFEIHCHGGPAATARIIEDLRLAGAIPTVQSDWYGDDLLINEASEVLARCVTSRTAAIALDQVRGSLRNWAQSHLAALASGKDGFQAANHDARQFLQFAARTTRLADPLRVVLFGPPNVGKSSLLNAIVGFDRSITLDAAGTTRDVLHADTVIDGLPIRISDTAGIQASNEPIEQQGIQRAQEIARDADLVLLVTDPSHGVWMQPETDSSRYIRVLNKLDLSDGTVHHDFEVATNALSGQGVDQLMDHIAAVFGKQLPPRGQPVAINDRQSMWLGEIARAETRTDFLTCFRSLLGHGDDSQDSIT